MGLLLVLLALEGLLRLTQSLVGAPRTLTRGTIFTVRVVVFLLFALQCLLLMHPD